MLNSIFSNEEELIRKIWAKEYWIDVGKRIFLYILIGYLADGVVCLIDALGWAHPEKGLCDLGCIVAVFMLLVMYSSIFSIFPGMLCVYKNDTRRYMLYKLAWSLAFMLFLWTICSHQILLPLVKHTAIFCELYNHIIELWNRLDVSLRSHIEEGFVDFIFAIQWGIKIGAVVKFVHDLKSYYHTMIWFKFVRKGERILIGKDASTMREAYVSNVGLFWIALYYKDKNSTEYMDYKKLCKAHIEHIGESSNGVKQSCKKTEKTITPNDNKNQSVKQKDKTNADKISAILSKVSLIGFR